MKSSRRIIALLVCSTLVASLLQACSTATPTAAPPTPEVIQTEKTAAGQDPTQAPETVKLKVITQPFITFVPFYIALEEGYYAEQGLEVELVSVTRNQEILPALSSGQADASSGLLSSGILNAIARGGNIKIVADKGYIDPDKCDNYALIAQRDLAQSGEIKSAGDLRGHTVNVVPASWLEYYLTKLLETGGLTMQDIQTSEVPLPAQPEAFEQKTLEFAINSEPWITRFMKAGHGALLTPPSQLLPDGQTAVILYGPTLLGENADLGTRLMTAYLKGVRQYNEGKTPRNMELVAKFTELESELLEEMCWPALRYSGELNVQGVLDFQQWALDAGYLDSALSAEQFWDGSFVTNANRALDEE